ncbi:MAG: ATP-binding cassette domain-containing protein [Lapillicoccus sp.]
MNANATTVTLRDVVKRFGSAEALTAIDLDLGQGVTGLLGPNGAGKTTLLRILATVIAPTSGRVRLLGLDPDDVDERVEVRRTLGYLPQELGFPRGFTAFRFVDYMAVLKEWTEPAARHAEVRRVLDHVGALTFCTKRVRILSGGQRRRVALAQALIGDPRLLILDEPTTGLDPEQRAVLRGVLSSAGHRSTVVLATHQTEDVAALCERVIVLDGGRIRWAGKVTELVATAAGKVWLADQPDPGALSSWRTGTGRHHHVGVRPPSDAELVEPSLEDAYLLLLGRPQTDRATEPRLASAS